MEEFAQNQDQAPRRRTPPVLEELVVMNEALDKMEKADKLATDTSECNVIRKMKR